MALTDNLIAYYKLDETSGTTAVDSVGSYNGTNNGATINQTGKIGKAYSFEGVNDYISTTLTIPAATSATLASYSAWVYYGGSEVKAFGSDAGSTGQIHLYASINATGLTFGETYFGGGSSDGPDTYSFTPTNGWYHIVIVKTAASKFDIYLNGVKRLNQLNRTATVSSNFSLGRSYSTAYHATIEDEVGIWNKALSTDEITELYNSGSGITYPFLPYYSLTVNSVGLGTGNIVLNPSGGSYEEDTEVTITASVNDGDNRFYRYYGDVETTFENPITVTMTEDLVINCQFQKRTKIEDGVIF